MKTACAFLAAVICSANLAFAAVQVPTDCDVSVARVWPKVLARI